MQYQAYSLTVIQDELIEQATTFGRAEKVDAVWLVLEGQTIIGMAAPLARALDAPLYCQIWDLVSWWLDAHGVDAENCERTYAAFDDAFRHSLGVATASWAMAESYSKQYGVRCLPVIYSQH